MTTDGLIPPELSQALHSSTEKGIALKGDYLPFFPIVEVDYHGASPKAKIDGDGKRVVIGSEYPKKGDYWGLILENQRNGNEQRLLQISGIKIGKQNLQPKLTNDGKIIYVDGQNNEIASLNLETLINEQAAPKPELIADLSHPFTLQVIQGPGILSGTGGGGAPPEEVKFVPPQSIQPEIEQDKVIYSVITAEGKASFLFIPLHYFPPGQEPSSLKFNTEKSYYELVLADGTIAAIFDPWENTFGYPNILKPNTNIRSEPAINRNNVILNIGGASPTVEVIARNTEKKVVDGQADYWYLIQYIKQGTKRYAWVFGSRLENPVQPDQLLPPYTDKELPTAKAGETIFAPEEVIPLGTTLTDAFDDFSQATAAANIAVNPQNLQTRIEENRIFIEYPFEGDLIPLLIGNRDRKGQWELRKILLKDAGIEVGAYLGDPTALNELNSGTIMFDWSKRQKSPTTTVDFRWVNTQINRARINGLENLIFNDLYFPETAPPTGYQGIKQRESYYRCLSNTSEF